jgi:3-dehydroquinate dehydratase-1
VLTLLNATNQMDTQYAEIPLITMSMGQLGICSRICGGVFGSALTFGAGKNISAPGQIGVQELRRCLQQVHGEVGLN